MEFSSGAFSSKDISTLLFHLFLLHLYIYQSKSWKRANAFNARTPLKFVKPMYIENHSRNFNKKSFFLEKVKTKGVD